MMTEHSNSIMGVTWRLQSPTHEVQSRRRGMSLNVGDPPPQASPQNAAQIVPKCHNEKAGLVAQLSCFVGREAHCRSILRKKPGDEPGFSVSISVTTAAASISYCRIIM